MLVRKDGRRDGMLQSDVCDLCTVSAELPGKEVAVSIENMCSLHCHFLAFIIHMTNGFISHHTVECTVAEKFVCMFACFTLCITQCNSL